jgi:hypothetical protein
MKTNDQNELIRLLTIFFDEFKINKKNFTNQNKIAALLKARLKEIHHWKDLPRGIHPYKPKHHKEVLRVAKQREKLIKKALPDEPPF